MCAVVSSGSELIISVPSVNAAAGSRVCAVSQADREGDRERETPGTYAPGSAVSVSVSSGLFAVVGPDNGPVSELVPEENTNRPRS